ncbi:antirestriction protein, partial [Escherichia coli]|nr:antirestriction protein [Escherichia coli]
EKRVFLVILFTSFSGSLVSRIPGAVHACRTECYAMTVHYYRLRDYALQHPECSAIMRIID